MSRATGAVAGAELFAERLWESSVVGAAVVDVERRVVAANEALARLAQEPLPGRDVTEVAVPAHRGALAALFDDADSEWRTLRLALAEGSDYEIAVVADGDRRLLIAEPLAADVAELNAQLLDLNRELVSAQRELRRSRDRLEEQNRRLLELDRLKTELVSLVSHEFRTPLTSVRGYVELLLAEGGLSPRQARFLRVVERNNHRLLRLMNDLLLAAQAEAGMLMLTATTVDAARLAAECVQSAAPLAAAKGLRLELDTGGAGALEADAQRLAQLLDNLLTNAIKFTPRGGSVELAVSGDRNSTLFEVRDSGVGIPVEERALIFDRFYRTRAAARRGVAGSGLGLAVVKAIVDAHGGAVVVGGAPGGGTTVSVELPARQPDAR